MSGTSSICPLCGCKGYWVSDRVVFVENVRKKFVEFICSLDTCRNIFHSGVFNAEN